MENMSCGTNQNVPAADLEKAATLQYVMDLADALCGYRGHTLKEMLYIFHKAIVVKSNGARSLELEIVEVEAGLPKGFFKKALDLIDITNESAVQEGVIL
ncbi:hypothetical protein [Paenibacillus sp. NPDC057934]|uniref:hypothetical protein n=1 Tax=Paenibacillus sp. NPDC057934 TaxID=3346282 RepID=UPI0036D8CC6D